MRDKFFAWLCCLIVIFIFQAQGWAASESGISITGTVKQPIRLTLENLVKYQSINVRLNEVDSDKYFFGVFDYRGVPLRTLLELAFIQKEEASFLKLLDMAIVIRNKVGKQIVLSWGEVFFRNPADIIIAYSASPIMPERAEGREKWRDTLNRPIGFPKLVIANDFYNDRCMEAVNSIEVIVLDPTQTPRMPHRQPLSFTISGSVKTPLTISDLSGYTRKEVILKVVGSGRGYQGLQKVSGVPLINLLEKAGARMDNNTVYLITHSDGYRAAVSFGELFLDLAGRRILIGDGNNNQDMDGKEGRFTLFIPHDLLSDRNVKGIESIEVINLNPSPKVYIISVGCADTSLLTLEALSYLSKTDAVVCSGDIAKRYAYYIGDRPVLFDPFTLLMPKVDKGKENKNVSHQEREKLKAAKIAEAVTMIREALNQGKSVALLEYGDPSIYGGLRGIHARFADYEKKFIPGVSAFNAANALIGKEMACKGSMILSSPWTLKENPEMLKAVAKKGDTLAIFMGLKEIKDLIPLLKKYYPGATPVNFAIRAGYSQSHRLIKTTLNRAAEAAEKENEGKESWLGMIYVGSCLE